MHGMFLIGSRQPRHEQNHENTNIVLRHVDTYAWVLKKNYIVVNQKTHANEQQQFDGTRENVSSSLLCFQNKADLRSDTLLERTRNDAIVSNKDDQE
jgi:hypothetical protein